MIKCTVQNSFESTTEVLGRAPVTATYRTCDEISIPTFLIIHGTIDRWVVTHSSNAVKSTEPLIVCFVVHH